jgi:hypothetical protein
LDSLWVSHVWQIEYEDEEQEQHAISNFAFWTSLSSRYFREQIL